MSDITREEFADRVWAWIGARFSHDNWAQSKAVKSAMMVIYDDDPDYACGLTLIQIYDRCGVDYRRGA